jgi:hypothetical protein
MPRGCSGFEAVPHSDQYRQGYRRASKDAVDWLHREAAEMNDPHAKRILDAAAFHLGIALKRSVSLEPRPPDGVSDEAR